MRFKLTNLFFVFLLLSVSFSPVLAAEPADVAPSTPAFALERAPLSKGWSFPPVPILNPMDTDDTPDRQTVIPPSDDDAAVPQVSLHLDPLFSRINDTHNFGFSDTLQELEPAQSPSESICGFDSVRVRATDTGQLVSTTGIGVAFVGADPNQPLTMTVTLNKGAEIVTMDCDKNLYPFEYAVVSFPQEYFPHVDATNPLARLESDGTIVVLPTYLDPENQRIYVATTAFCNILDFNGCLLPSLKQIRGKTNGPTPEFITTIEAHRNAASQEIRDFLVCLALGAWAQDFVKEVNQHSAACLLGDLTGSFAPGIGQAKAIADAVKFASEGKLVEFAFAATAAVPGRKLFTAIGKGGGAALKIEKVAKTAKIIANTGPHTLRASLTAKGGVRVVLSEGIETGKPGSFGWQHIIRDKRVKDFKNLGYSSEREIQSLIQTAVQKGDWAVSHGTKENNFIYYNLGARGRKDKEYVFILIGDTQKDHIITAFPTNKEYVQKQVWKLKNPGKALPENDPKPLWKSVALAQ